MMRLVWIALVMAALASCRDYDFQSRLTDQDGLVPPDQFARYGREQAQEIAIAREYARAHTGSSRADREKQAEAAVSYARTLPDVTDIQADPLGYRITIHFRSGWLTMVNPIDDGKAGGETPGLPTVAGTGR
ncbi:MAG TPA: hypothetical protein VF252_12730 [Gemmatimonadales bacterium]